ncbi:selenide, water dikinase SelD, partial [candidate division KSB1 bacterium]|nr:selenide, water dikinase SelD [candidate division KSB1 bacterium]
MSKVKMVALPNVLVGLEDGADAGIFQLRDDLALVQTVDFFTPIVDDPYDFGRIAATNSLNDVYVMGGKPVTALNIACFPKNGDPDWLVAILNGGLTQAAAAGVAIIGGHTVEDDEIKYGLAVTGTIHPQKIIHNHTAQVGDALVLTKGLGTGILSTALKFGKLGEPAINALVQTMTRLNLRASEAMVAVGAHAATDITGFGLLGHAHELALASRVTFRIAAHAVPILPETLHYAQDGCLTGGGGRNGEFVKKHLHVSTRIDALLLDIFQDPQTAGGL